MKFRHIAFLLMLLVIVGCAKQPGPAQPSEPAQTEQSGSIQPTETATEPQKEMAPEAKKIIDSISKVTSYSFSNANGIVYVKGDRAKIELYKNWGNTGATLYNIAYLDLKAKKAYAVCTKVNDCSYEMRQQYREVEYAPLDIGKLPPEYVKEIKYAEIDYTRTRTIPKASGLAKTYLFKYVIGGAKYEAWLDQFYGFPYEITISKDSSSTTAVFKDVQVNNVADKDVALPSDLKLTG